MEAGAKDLLRRFSGGFSPDKVTCGVSDDLELGLSLGGCFTSNESEKSRLVRSSSIPDMIQSEFSTVGPLLRSCSMPCDSEEEIRKRKVVLSVKRTEAKKKREERRNLRSFDAEFEGGSLGKMRRFEVGENGVESSSRKFEMGSQGSSSSGGSEFDSKAGQGFEFPANPMTSSKHNNHKVSSISTSPTTPTSKSIDNADLRRGIMLNENVLRKKEGEGFGNGKISDVGTKIMEEMPSVSTKGDGPNGRRIDGFLYRYGKGEVSIVCVCHGSFLTPAEFVKHGGGGDVDHPLRHIVVNPGFL